MSGLSPSFDTARHPRDQQDGRFVSQRGRQAVIRALPAIRGHSGPSMSPPAMREASPGPERRSPTRGESWQRLGNKIAALPIDYTGNSERERPVGSYLHLTLNNQIPKSVPVDDHQAKVKRFIQIANENRKPIIEAATKVRAGKKHVYLKAHEPAARGVARWRMKPDKFPEGTPPETLHRAYNHAALLAMHDRGLVDYDFKMDDALKAELKPTEPFIRYARTQLNAKASEAMPGVRQEQMEHFGQSWTDQHGRPRKRFRPNQQLIKAAPIDVKLARLHARRNGLAEPPLRTEPLRAAGMMLVSQGKGAPRVLLLKRASGGDHAGEWCFPGGKIEDGESPKAAAMREAAEEAGKIAYGTTVKWTQRIADGVDFTTFMARVRAEQQPTLNNEHSAWKWASIDDLPRPMHPGCAVAIDKLNGETGTLSKASPVGAFIRRGVSRAASALDSVSESSASQQEAAAAAGTTISRAKRFFGPKRPGSVNRVGYTAGRGAARGVKSFAKNPIRALKSGISEGARGGSGFAQGISDEFGGSARTRRIAGRIGAVSGALKVPVIAGAIAAKPVKMAYNELGGGNQNKQNS